MLRRFSKLLLLHDHFAASFVSKHEGASNTIWCLSWYVPMDGSILKFGVDT